MWPCTQFYTPKGLILSDIWARRFRPATARCPAHFSQKNNNNGKPQMFGKELSPLCDGTVSNGNSSSKIYVGIFFWKCPNIGREGEKTLPHKTNGKEMSPFLAHNQRWKGSSEIAPFMNFTYLFFTCQVSCLLSRMIVQWQLAIPVPNNTLAGVKMNIHVFFVSHIQV